MKDNNRSVSKWPIGAITLLLVMSFSDASHACRWEYDLKIESVVQAETVFVGEIVKYEVVGSIGSWFQYAVLTFSVSEYLAGAKPEKEIEVRWDTHSTFALQKKLKHRHLVAIATEAQSPLTGLSAETIASKRLNLPRVLQESCSDPFLLEPTTQNIEQVKSLLKTKPSVQETK